jgi:hypothetical protein
VWGILIGSWHGTDALRSCVGQATFRGVHALIHHNEAAVMHHTHHIMIILYKTSGIKHLQCMWGGGSFDFSPLFSPSSIPSFVLKALLCLPAAQSAVIQRSYNETSKLVGLKEEVYTVGMWRDHETINNNINTTD